MKHNLYLYACSFGKFGSSVGINAHNWVDENSFGDVLSKKINLKLINRSQPGGSNFHIFDKVMQDINSISENDLVIIQYSFINRAYCTDHKKTVMPHHLEFEEYYQKFYSDRQSFAMLVSFNEYLKKKIKGRLIFSCVDNLHLLKTIDNTMYEDFTNDDRFVSTQTNSPIEYLYRLSDKTLLFPCTHPSMSGHIKLAELYYDFITKMERSSIG